MMPEPAAHEDSASNQAWARSLKPLPAARARVAAGAAALLLAAAFVAFSEPAFRLLLLFLPCLAAGYGLGSRWAAAFSGGAAAAALLLAWLVPGAAAGLGVSAWLWSCLAVGGALLLGGLRDELHRHQERSAQVIGEYEQIKALWRESSRELERRSETLDVSRQRLEAVLNTAMDPVVAKLIIERRLQNEKRNVSVLFSDLVNFSEHSHGRPPEEVIEDLNRYFGEMIPALSCFHAHLDKFIGDGIMAEFGSPHPARHHPLLATLAGIKMQERLKSRNFPWRMRIGVATGGVLVGLIGSRARRNYTAIGDVVNLAARLQAISPPGSVCVDESCFRFVERWCQARPMRTGLSADRAKEHEARLALLEQAIAHAPTRELCLEAADIASELERMDDAKRFHQLAIDLVPPERRAAEAAITAALLTGPERMPLSVKGKRVRVPAYEILGLKDFLASSRLPKEARPTYLKLKALYDLREDELLATEALEGALGHSQVTAALSACLGEALGLDEEEVRHAFLAGFYSDLGKCRVPEHLLSCPENLQELPASDRERVQTHVAAAPAALGELGVDLPPEALDAIAHHHERWDGSGYPESLRGSQISLLGQIVHLADRYETSTAWRPHQEAWAPQSALAEIRRDVQSGGLDSRVGNVFLKMMGA